MCVNYRTKELGPEDFRKMVHQAAVESGLAPPDATPNEAIIKVLAAFDTVLAFAEQKGLALK